jgi:hypothetical protein
VRGVQNYLNKETGYVQIEPDQHKAFSYCVGRATHWRLHCSEFCAELFYRDTMFSRGYCSLPSTMDDMAVMSASFRLEERGSHDKLFHTKAVVRDRVCALTTDHWSSINVASIEMVEKLGLPRTPHPQAYYLRWGSEEFTITQQTKVQFCMGKFSGEVCCDIILVYIDGFVA